MQMRYVDLFCGAGGASCGLTRAGWENVGAADWDAHALSVYALNFPDHSVHRLDLAQPLPADLVAQWRAALGDDGAVWASSPCTDFSTANLHPSGERSSLTAALAQHVLALAPRWFLFENVPRARNSAEFAALREALGAAGYATTHAVVTATGAGMAQTRKRLFLVASRDGGCADEVLARFVASCEQHDAGTMRACFADAGVACPAPFVYLPSCNERYRKSVFTLDGPGPTVRGYLRPFRATYPFPPRDDTHDATQVFPATLEHIAALQGFPPHFRWCGSKTARAKCIGNAVPPPLAERLARAVFYPESP